MNRTAFRYLHSETLWQCIFGKAYFNTGILLLFTVHHFIISALSVVKATTIDNIECEINVLGLIQIPNTHLELDLLSYSSATGTERYFLIIRIMPTSLYLYNKK